MKQPRLFEMPMAALYPMDVDHANDLLVRWGHKLGPCERPFYQEAFALEVAGRPISVAISASIVHGPVAGFTVTEVVELARQAACEPWANRLMIRLWREVCALRWPCWTVKAGVSYSKNSDGPGNLYRFDGWERVRTDAGSSGGGSHSTKRQPGDPKLGDKSLWLWRYAA